MKKIIIRTIVVVAFFLNLQVFPQENILLQYKMPVGKNYLYNTNISSDITQEVMGQEMKIGNNVHSLTRIVIERVEGDGNLNLIISSDSISVQNKMQGKDTTINLNELTGKRTRITLTKFGELIKKEMIDSLSQNQEMMSSSISLGATNLYFKLPGKEIKTGENWTSSKIDTVKSMGGGIVVSSDYIYTLGSKENKNGKLCYKIPYTANVSSKGKVDMSGMEFYIEGNGKMSGDIYMDSETGAIVTIEGINENEMSLASTGQQNMVIPVSQKSKMSINLIVE